MTLDASREASKVIFAARTGIERGWGRKTGRFPLPVGRQAWRKGGTAGFRGASCCMAARDVRFLPRAHKTKRLVRTRRFVLCITGYYAAGFSSCVSGLTKQQSMAFLPEPQGHISSLPQHCTYGLPEPQAHGAFSFSSIVCSAMVRKIKITPRPLRDTG
jgi:hypothetical protein